ncbi:anaerobic ribonucleoside-triphosphate reductase [Clostridium tyrobutyricum]|nr:anaerobic ribonucleoside-triphosphate reductase [Clostridium tyrobutyricum]QCH26937.1 Anaerobic ribonucleoside-triphosphate reductase [Clostridium tyrobutyricum]
MHERDLANFIDNPIGIIEKYGSQKYKQYLLHNVIPEKFSKMHENRILWIHDLEYYNLTYNCIGIKFNDIPHQNLNNSHQSFDESLRILFRFIVKLTNQQSGGIGIINFDIDLSTYITTEIDEQISYSLKNFLNDINLEVRKGCEMAYVTLNIGLDTSKNGRRLIENLLNEYLKGDFYGKPFIFPNIVFKIKNGFNLKSNDYNYDLYLKATKVTSKCMNPTYLNCDSIINKNIDPLKLGIMGCRTLVIDNIFGEKGSIRRGNISCITINLPQIAMLSTNIENFLYRLKKVMYNSAKLLEHRFYGLCNLPTNTFKFLIENKLYLNTEKRNLYDIFKNGTLSIGFIGLWEALEIILNKKAKSKEFIKDNIQIAEKIIKFMSTYTNYLKGKEKLNFSLIGTSSENVSGMFPKNDLKKFGKMENINTKGYYTNSFHIPVEVKVNCFEKISYEGLFHKYCNGGSISYVEFKEAPINNSLGVKELLDYAIKNDCNYIGINFPLDICNDCGYRGLINDKCKKCNSTNILRLRRVSGYLSNINNFSYGKMHELDNRTSISTFDKL